MKKRMLVCLLGVLLTTGVFAQNYAFRVLINKGKNEIKSGDTWVPVKVGSSIGKDDEIRVTENAYVGLVHVTGKSLELKDAKVYKATDLSAKIGQGSNVLNKYTDFVISNNSTRKNNLAATGAVHRGPNSIKLFLPKPEASVVYNNKITFSWEKTEPAAPSYTVYFRSMFGDELKKVEVTTPTVSIDLGEVTFENEDNIVVQVFTKDKTKASGENDYTIKKLSKADKDRLKNSVNELKDAVAEPTAINKVLLAGFYESNNLLIDAATAYEDAIKLAPDVPEIQEAYRAFLIVHGMKELKK